MPALRIGILGGGQLGRMLTLAGYPLGHRFRFLDPAPDAPAGQVGELIRGEFDDPGALDAFADGLDAATLEFENVPMAAVEHLASRVPFFPGPDAIRVGQERLAEKTLFSDLGIEVGAYRGAQGRDEFDTAIREIGYPCVVKTRRLGYDGKGQALLRTSADADRAFAMLGAHPLIVERFIDFARELSIIAVRGLSGEFAAYPLVQNTHAGGVLRASIAPAPDVGAALQSLAESHARAVMERLGYVGVLAIEFFAVGRGGGIPLIANEMAPRVHNSGHWTIEGAVTSQFENHVRAVTGMPLGSCESRGPSVMLNILGQWPDRASLLRIPGLHIHDYGKMPRPGRKIGHVTVTGRDASEVAARAATAERLIADRDRSGGRTVHP